MKPLKPTEPSIATGPSDASAINRQPTKTPTQTVSRNRCARYKYYEALVKRFL